MFNRHLQLDMSWNDTIPQSAYISDFFLVVNDNFIFSELRIEAL